MTSGNDYSVHGTERTGELQGTVPVSKNDDGYLKRPPRRNGRRPRGAARPAATSGESPPADPPPAPQTGEPPPSVDDAHVDYYI